MAFRLGLHDRDLFRGVAATGAVLPLEPPEAQAAARLSFSVAVGDCDPLAQRVEEGRDKLAARKYPLVFRKVANMGHHYPDRPTVRELARWLDSLDRLEGAILSPRPERVLSASMTHGVRRLAAGARSRAGGIAAPLRTRCRDIEPDLAALAPGGDR
jgi:hypothetical protein